MFDDKHFLMKPAFSSQIFGGRFPRIAKNRPFMFPRQSYPVTAGSQHPPVVFLWMTAGSQHPPVVFLRMTAGSQHPPVVFLRMTAGSQHPPVVFLRMTAGSSHLLTAADSDRRLVLGLLTAASSSAAIRRISKHNCERRPPPVEPLSHERASPAVSEVAELSQIADATALWAFDDVRTWIDIRCEDGKGRNNRRWKRRKDKEENRRRNKTDMRVMSEKTTNRILRRTAWRRSGMTSPHDGLDRGL